MLIKSLGNSQTSNNNIEALENNVKFSRSEVGGSKKTVIDKVQYLAEPKIDFWTKSKNHDL